MSGVSDVPRRVLQTLCANRQQLVVLFSIHLMIIVMLLFIFPHIDPRSGSNVVAVLALLLSSSTVIVTFPIILLCWRRSKDHPGTEPQFES